MSPQIRSMMGENHLSVREPANPRVLALHYRVANNDDLIYRTAERSVHRRDGFDVVMDDGRVVFEFHDHYPSEELGRAGVRDFIDEWEFQADLAIGARKFRLEFVRAEIVDRHPVHRCHIGARATRFSRGAATKRLSPRTAARWIAGRRYWNPRQRAWPATAARP